MVTGLDQTLPTTDNWPITDVKQTLFFSQEEVKKRAAFVLVDLETTGLVAHEELPLEIGVRVCDVNLKTLAQRTQYVKPFGWQDQLNSASEIVREMHKKSGLWDALNELPDGYTDISPHNGKENWFNYEPSTVAMILYYWLVDEIGLEPDKFPMTGSTVNLDRAFLEEHFIVLYNFFHYRNIDVSSLKMLCRIVNPDVAAAWDEISAKGEKAHRPQEDLDWTCRELKFYIDEFLMTDLRVDADGQMMLWDEGAL
jgi:oligoribonuclease